MVVPLIPLLNFSVWNFDQLVALRAIVEGNHFLADFVASETRNAVNPKPKVDRTAHEARRISALKQRGIVITRWVATYMPTEVTTYVAYQKLTSPPVAPPAGGYHGMMSR